MTEIMWQTLIYLLVVALLTAWAFCKKSGFLYIIDAAALTFLSIFWLINYRDPIGWSFFIIIGSAAAFVGHEIWSYYRGK